MASTPKQLDSGRWQIKIRRKGHSLQSKTFKIKADAEAWARKTESELERGVWQDSTKANTTTLKTALENYMLTESHKRKKSAAREKVRIRSWINHPLAKRTLAGIQGDDISDFRDSERRRGLAENTIRLNIALISVVYETARKDWRMKNLINPCRQITLPGGSRKRERRISPEEEAGLLANFKIAMPRTKHTKELFELAIETGMRQSELLRIVWSDVKITGKYIRLDITKTGDPRDAPLSPKAIQILESMPTPITGGRVFNITQDRLVRGFKDTCNLAKIDNLKFHDTRHEAASRWASVLHAQELAKMFGWRTMQMALRYYHPTALSIADKLAKA